MASIDKYLEDPEFANWVKSGLALNITNEVLRPFVVKEITKLHQSIVKTLPRGVSCTGCSVDTACPKGICDEIQREIENKHWYPNPSFTNTCTGRWSADPWEIAKCYMPPLQGYKRSAASDADFSACINVIINCKHFQAFGTSDPRGKETDLSKSRDFRNLVMHGSSQKVTENDMKENLDILINILNMIKTPETEADTKEAREKIEMTKQLKIKFEDAIEVTKNAIEANADNLDKDEDQVQRERLLVNFEAGCRKALCRLTEEHISIQEGNLSVAAFLSKIGIFAERKDLCSRHQNMLFPKTGTHAAIREWDLFVYCFILEELDLYEPIGNAVSIFVREVKKIRNRIVIDASGVTQDDLSELCDYLIDTDLNTDITEIFNKDFPDVDVICSFNILGSWWREEEDYGKKPISKKQLNIKKQIMEDVDKRLSENKDTIKREILEMLGYRGEHVTLQGDNAAVLDTACEVRVSGCDEETANATQEHITFPDNNDIERNEAIDHFRQQRNLLKVTPEKGSIILNVKCSSITNVLDFWDSCIDGRAVEALSKVRDYYRRYFKCDTLKFDVILTKKVVSRCVNEIVKGLPSHFERLIVEVTDEVRGILADKETIQNSRPVSISNNGPPDMARSQRFVLAALDIGSTYSGYAYTFKSEYKKDKSKLYANRWDSDGASQANLKTPTVVLFDKNKVFDSLGYEAEKKYANLAENGEHIGWRYFRYFKMELYREDQRMLPRKIRLYDDQRKRMLAVDVFAAAIKGLVDHLIKSLNARAVNEIRETDVEWLITVPAIWTDGAKQFMQLAARQAGLSDEHVSLALEPEAAAVYTSQIGMQKCFVDGVGFDFRPFDVKEKFMVIDLGGGTVDMTFHEVTSDGGIGQIESSERLTTHMRSSTAQSHTDDPRNVSHTNGVVDGVDDGADDTTDTVDGGDDTGITRLAEIHAPEGGHWGGNLVNEDLEEFMRSIFTEKVWNTLTRDPEYKVVKLEVVEALETVKRNTGNLTEDVKFSIPQELLDLFQETVGLSLKEHVETDPTIGIYATKRGGKWGIKLDKLIKMFDRSLERLISCLEALNESEEVNQINTLVLVGGFAESSVVQRAIRERFPKKRVVVPEEPSLAVVKGAVMYGFDNHVIRSRIMKHTYGICVAKAFDASIHPEKFKVTNSRGQRCENIFEVMIEAGTIVIPNETKVSREFNGSYVSLSTQAEVSIYISSEKRPMFVTEEGCSHVGSVEFLLQREGSGREDRLVDVTFHFGHTKITVTVKEKASGRVIESRFKCLN